jgi:hypothetical protein
MTQTIVKKSDLPRLLTTYKPGTTLELKILPGAIEVTDNTPKTKADLIAEKFADLKGVGISISQAAKKYGVPRGVIDPWVYVSKIVHFTDETCYPKLVDEAEVALCAEIYKERQKTNTAGLPYFDAEDRVITTVKRPAISRKPKAKAA